MLFICENFVKKNLKCRYLVAKILHFLQIVNIKKNVKLHISERNLGRFINQQEKCMARSPRIELNTNKMVITIVIRKVFAKKKQTFKVIG